MQRDNGTTPKPSQRYVLCRPRGGLNDTLCQIELCWRYAERYQRQLIIDCGASGGLHGDFGLYFQPRHLSQPPIITRLDNNLIEHLNTLSCCPVELTSQIGQPNRDAIWSEADHEFRDPISGTSLTFNFHSDHRESILIHEQCGGGNLSFYLLERLRFSRSSSDHIQARIRPLGHNYIAIHIRNTDYRTDYQNFLSCLAPQLAGMSVLICSDDARVFTAAEELLPHSSLLQASETPNLDGLALHGPDAPINPDWRHEQTLAALVDLVALAHGKKLHITNTTLGELSGFSRLAKHLNANKDVIGSLLGQNNLISFHHHWRRHIVLHNIKQSIKLNSLAQGLFA